MTMQDELTIGKWDDRNFALHDGDELVCVTVYKKGAVNVKSIIEDLRRTIKELRGGDGHGKISEPVGISDVER